MIPSDSQWCLKLSLLDFGIIDFDIFDLDPKWSPGHKVALGTGQRGGYHLKERQKISLSKIDMVNLGHSLWYRERGAKHSPPGNNEKFHENHEILKIPKNHPGVSRIIRDHS